MITCQTICAELTDAVIIELHLLCDILNAAFDRLIVITVGILMQLGESGPGNGVRYSRGFAIAEFVISVFFHIG